MSDIQFSSQITVRLVRSMAGDDMVVQAAQVSSKGENNPDTVPERLIQALMKGRHGSPFEHNAFTFFVEAPLFVFREWQRHRVGSFNEMSGRYTELPPRFYIPDSNRRMYNTGTKMKPDFVSFKEYAEGAMLTKDVSAIFPEALEQESMVLWSRYMDALNNGIANEVARMVLPLNIYSQMYWTVNARSLMNFLSLRVDSPASLVRSYPQYEIQLGASRVETYFAHMMPLTYRAFVDNGRVGP